MILRNEFISEKIVDKGLLIDSIENYLLINQYEEKISIRSINKSEFNDSSVDNLFAPVTEIDLEDFSSIVSEKIFENKYTCIWQDTNDSYYFVYYNTISNESQTGQVLNTTDIKDVNFKLLDDSVWFNLIGIEDDVVYITEDMQILDEDLIPNKIELSTLDALSNGEIDKDEDYKMEFNNLNTILISQGKTLYSAITDRFSSNIDNNVPLNSYKFAKVNFKIGVNVDNDDLFYDFVCYDELRLEDEFNNISGYALDYMVNIDAEIDSYPLYKISIPLFESGTYNIDNQTPIYHISDSGEQLHLPSYPTNGSLSTPTDYENFYTMIGNNVYPNTIKRYYNEDLNFDIVQSNNLNISYSYEDDDVNDLELDKLEGDIKFHFYKNYIQTYNSDYNLYNKFIHILDKDINKDVMFVNIAKLLPAKLRSNKYIRKITDVMETIYNGGMKDLNDPNTNILFNNMGKHYSDDKKLYFLYRGNLDAWFYDKNNLALGDNVFKFFENLDQYKKMSKIPFEDIFTFAKSFGIDYLINENVFMNLKKTNNITDPNISVNTIGSGKLDEEYVRNSLSILRSLSKYRGSTNFYEMILSVMGFAADIELQVLNTNNSKNKKGNFASLTNDVTIELDNNYFKSKNDYVKEILSYMVNLIDSTLYLNRNFVGITFKTDYTTPTRLISYGTIERHQTYDEVVLE